MAKGTVTTPIPPRTFPLPWPNISSPQTVK